MGQWVSTDWLCHHTTEWHLHRHSAARHHHEEPGCRDKNPVCLSHAETFVSLSVCFSFSTCCIFPTVEMLQVCYSVSLSINICAFLTAHEQFGYHCFNLVSHLASSIPFLPVCLLFASLLCLFMWKWSLSKTVWCVFWEKQSAGPAHLEEREFDVSVSVLACVC